MTTISFTALHYGLPYLRAALLSVAPAVDRFVIAYSPVGSHGTRVDNLPPIDTEADLRAVADRVAAETGKPLQWYSGDWRTEGQQRDSVYQAAPDARIVLVVDSDEVYADGGAITTVQAARMAKARYCRVPFVHHWRSFGWACHDAAWPVRAINVRLPNDDAYLDVPAVHHFGYAMPEIYMEYKWLLHGHRGEMSPERWRDWFGRYQRWTPDADDGDCHPVNLNYWRPMPYEGAMPSVLRDHIFAELEIVR